MDEWSRFELKGHVFVAYLPSSREEPKVFTLVVSKEGQEVRRETVPLLYEPVFGPDVGDVAALNERVEEVVRELGLEDDDGSRGGAGPEVEEQT